LSFLRDSDSTSLEWGVLESPGQRGNLDGCEEVVIASLVMVGSDDIQEASGEIKENSGFLGNGDKL
jgi:hypothetical protein